MATLTITITNETNQDYDGVDEDVRIVKGDIDGTPLHEEVSCEDTATDAACKTSFKDLLTDKGYTWDTEV